MKAQWIRAIGRTRCEHTGQGATGIRAGMNLEHVPPSLMKPSDDDEFISGRDPVESGNCKGAHFQPRVGRTLGSLFRGFGS